MGKVEKRKKIIIIYCSSESNKTLAYQTGWPVALMKNIKLKCYPINLGQNKYAAILKLIYFLIFKRNIEGILLLHSVYSNTKQIPGIMVNILKKENRKKIYFLANEYKLMPDKIKLVNNIKPTLVFTQSYDKKIVDLYAKSINAKVKSFSSCAIDEGRFNYKKAFEERKIDIGYRSYKSPTYLGHNERHEIAEYFKNYCKKNGLISNISLEPDKRLTESEYAAFLNDCKFQIGTEAGGDYFEMDDKTRIRINKYLETNQDEMIEIYKVFFVDKERCPWRSISGRHIEAAACGSVQILFKGNYSGFMKAGVHYISLEKDFSNINQVIETMNDRQRVKAIRDNGIKLAKEIFSYQKVIDRIIKEI